MKTHQPEATCPQIHPTNMNEGSAGSFSGESSAERETPSALPPRPNRIAVAIVDDDSDERLLMTRDVDRSPDLQSVASYGSGLEALEGIPLSATEVVLMDVRMPGLSGNECARQLRNVRPNLMIVMISGFDHPNASAQSQEAGADAYLRKPFSLDQFLEALMACLRRRNLGVNETDALQNFLAAQTKGARLPTTATSSLIDQVSVRQALCQMVIRMEKNCHARQDMMQEALVHLWLEEQGQPGKQLSWYLQSVKFHLYNLARHGRSVDSPRRSAARALLPANHDGREEWPDTLDFDDSIMSELNARDLLVLLEKKLEPIDWTILCALATGLEDFEVAESLHVSRMFVVRHRARIASLAVKLGILPVTPGQATSYY